MPRAYKLINMQEGGGTGWGGGIRRTAGRGGGNSGTIQFNPTNPAPTGFYTSPLNGGGGGSTGLDFLDEYLASQGITGPGSIGSSQQSSQSSSSQPVLPPALELLQEMRARRESEANQASIIGAMLAANTPRGQTNYLGFEPGGVADVLLGIITGNGPSAAAGILPADQRMVRRTDVPVPMGQPPVGSEFDAAQAMANAILEAIRNIGTGQSSSQGSSSSGPAS